LDVASTDLLGADFNAVDICFSSCATGCKLRMDKGDLLSHGLHCAPLDREAVLARGRLGTPRAVGPAHCGALTLSGTGGKAASAKWPRALAAEGRAAGDVIGRR
jgi:hypothetical protein